MNRVEVTKSIVGICHMQVCAIADATDKEILEACNKLNLSGTSAGWGTVIRKSDNKKMLPVVCDDNKDRKHFLVSC